LNRVNWLHDIVLPTVGGNAMAIEIGVWRGAYSFDIIAALNPSLFYGVDPYCLFDDYTDTPDQVEFSNQSNLDKLYSDVKMRYSQFTNAQLIRSTSADAVGRFEDNSVDFVYIDGDHTYEFVSQDIARWWPKIKPGGILSGHDYTPGNPQKNRIYGVIPAVDEFVARHSLDLGKTDEEYATWWVVKPK
jgi:hypothetical protein